MADQTPHDRLATNLAIRLGLRILRQREAEKELQRVRKAIRAGKRPTLVEQGQKAVAAARQAKKQTKRGRRWI